MMLDPERAIAPLTDPPTVRIHVGLWVTSETRRSSPDRVPINTPSPSTNGEVSMDDPSASFHRSAPVAGSRAIRSPAIVAKRASWGAPALALPGNPVSAGDAATAPPRL